MGQIELGVLQKRIHLETHIAVVAAGLLPDGQEDVLGMADQLVGQFPGDLLVAPALLHEAIDQVVAPSAGDKIGDDDRVRGGAGGPRGEIPLHQVRVDRIEPEFRTRCQEGLDGIHGTF